MSTKEFLIDWLQGTLPGKNRVRLFGLIRSCFAGGEFVQNSHGLRYYEQSYSHPSGAVVGVGQRLGKFQSNEPRDYLELSGRVVGMLSAHRLRWFMKGLSVLGFKASRIDLTLDDFGWSYNPRDPHEAYEVGNISGFRDTGRLVSKGRLASRGLSFSLGNRGRSGSGKFVQFYDKNLESRGKRDCCRCECSFYGDRAALVFKDLAALALDNWPLLIRSYLLVSVDFVDRSDSNRLDQCTRLEWWANLIEDTIPLCFEAREKDSEIYERIERWLRHQVAPSLSALFDILCFKGDGDTIKFWEFFYEILFDGSDRRNEALECLVNSYRVRSACL